MSDSEIKKLGKLDPAMALRPASGEGLTWYCPYESPMLLLGFHWFEQDQRYNRLPLAGAPGTFTRYEDGKPSTHPAAGYPVMELAWHTAGGQVRFRTNSTRFMIQGEVLDPGGMDHMAYTGCCGFDLYLKDEDRWRCYGVTRKETGKAEFCSELCTGISRTMRDVIIDFPMYTGVKSVFIGLDEDAEIAAPQSLVDRRPIVFYGTSITQGGCASRPGTASSNLLSRWLDREVINLGFSGNGRGEPEVARMLADIKDPAMYLIDYCWNVNPTELAATLPGLLDTLRASHPETPIVLMSQTPGVSMQPAFAKPAVSPGNRTRIMIEEAERRRAAGDKNISYFDAYHSLGEDDSDCTVDGAHLTDLGFYRLAAAMLPVVRGELRR